MPFLINDLDAKTTYGLTLSDAPGWADAPPATVPAAAAIRRQGNRVLGRTVEQARRVTLNGTVHGTSTQNGRDKIDALKLALKRDPVKLSFPDFAGRYVSAYLESFVAPPQGPSMLNSKLPVSAVLTAHDPYSYDNDPTVVAGNIRMPLGTGVVRPVLTVTGATNPTLTLYDTANNVVATMVFTVVLTGGQTLVVDCDLKTVKVVGVNNLSVLTTGDFFTIDPAEARYASPFPYIITSVGTLSVSYRKSWR